MRCLRKIRLPLVYFLLLSILDNSSAVALNNPASFIASAIPLPPTSRGSSAGSSNLGTSLYPAHKARDVGEVVLAETMNEANNPPSKATPLISFIQPIMDMTFLSYSQRLNLVKLYIDANLGKAALVTLKPLMHGTPHYQVMLLEAQSYAELELPIESLKYYELARSLAKTSKELEVTIAGIAKLQNWLNASIPSSLAPIDDTYSAYYQSIKLIKQYVNENKGKEALKKIKHILPHVLSYDIFLLSAQAYAETEDPQRALHYYQLAQGLAKSNVQLRLAQTGITSMQRWLILNKKKRITAKLLPEELACKEIMIRNDDKLSCSQRIRFARQYLSLNKAPRAITVLEPLLTKQATFEILILAAQAYAQANQPRLALAYYKSAFYVAKKPYEFTIALFGIAKMQFWRGNYYTAMQSYQRILCGPTTLYDFEIAKAGFIKSLAYAGRPISAYRSIPETLLFTTPDMVVAAAQATLWADQADLTKNILTNYLPIVKSIDPKSTLGRDLQDIQWQTALNTNPNVISPGEYYFEDSDHFSVLRSTLDYTHYWSQQYQSSIGFEQGRYKQLSSTLNAEGIYLRQKWRPTRELAFNGKIEPTNYQLWDPILWLFNSNYRPNDHIGAQLLAQREVIETFPAFAHHITDYQYNANLFFSPLPYLSVNGSLSRLDISDGNVRKGYFISATTVLSTELGLNLILQRRGYTDKFVSPYYFSPNQYNANMAILRIGRKTNSVWHYYVDGGLGNQNIKITGNPLTTSPTKQLGFGLNGPISQHLILNAYYTVSRQAAAFLDSRDYKYQYGSISLNILL